MKLITLVIIICLTTKLFSQQFDGAPNLNYTGDIYRSGNVGIGTGSTLNGKLHVYGDIVQSRNNGAFVFAQAYNTGEHFLAIAPNASGSYATDWQWAKGLNFDGWTGELTKFVSNNSDLAISVAVGTNKYFKVYGDGSVVLGNVSKPTGYKLYVDDGILAKRVKVALPSSSSDWMDVVFNPEYNLESIDSLKQFIKCNNHLPGMQSGQQLVESGGIDVFEMFKLQQMKIEELTLYIIKLNDELDLIRNGDQKVNNLK